jgi:hypothetical protein
LSKETPFFIPAKDKATETANRVEQTIRQNSLHAVAVDLRFLFGVFTSVMRMTGGIRSIEPEGVVQVMIRRVDNAPL